MFLVVCGNVDKYKTVKIVNDELEKLDIKMYKKPVIMTEKNH